MIVGFAVVVEVVEAAGSDDVGVRGAVGSDPREIVAYVLGVPQMES